MSEYNYIAKLDPKKNIHSCIEAESEQDAAAKLVGMGYFPVEIELASAKFKNFFGSSKVSSKELVQFSRQLATLIDSGVNIVNGLNIISRNSKKHTKIIISDILSKIKNGKLLSESMGLHPEFFPKLYFSMVHAGEVGGNLNITLKRLADYLESEEEFKGAIRASLIYPIFILIVGLATITVLLTFVIPKLVSMFEGMNQILPIPTRILISVSSLLRGYWWVILAAVLFLGFMIKRFINSAAGRSKWDALKLKPTILGNLILKSEISRFARTMSLLLSSAIPIVQSIEISASILNNKALAQEALSLKGKVIEGESFSLALRDTKLFPDFMITIVSIGEETGGLDKALLRVANDYEKDLEKSLKVITRLLEPIVILFMGLVVGFIVLAMLLPIFQINLIVK